MVADSLPQSIQVYRISSIVLQLALVGIHFHIELFGSEHESHVEHQRHSVTTKQGIHVPPISMPVIGRISGKADKPPAVYLLYLFHEGVFRTDKQRHIVIGEFRLCRNCYPATVLHYKRTFRTDHRQGERCLHKRINAVETSQFEEFRAHLVETAQYLDATDANRREELYKQLMIIGHRHLQRGIHPKGTAIAIVEHLARFVGQKHGIRPESGEILLAYIEQAFATFGMAVIDADMRHASGFYLATTEAIDLHKGSSVATLRLNRHPSGKCLPSGQRVE